MPVRTDYAGRYGFCGKSAVFKPAGGGKEGAVTNALLVQLQPQYAVISVKEKNRKELPSPAGIERFGANGVKLFTTAADGAVTILVNGQGNLQIQTEK